MAKLINVIFENSSPHRKFFFWRGGGGEPKYEISILSSDCRYFWSGALNRSHINKIYQ